MKSACGVDLVLKQLNHTRVRCSSARSRLDHSKHGVRGRGATEISTYHPDVTPSRNTHLVQATLPKGSSKHVWPPEGDSGLGGKMQQNDGAPHDAADQMHGWLQRLCTCCWLRARMHVMRWSEEFPVPKPPGFTVSELTCRLRLSSAPPWRWRMQNTSGTW